MLEYFTEKELRAQIGQDKEKWPISLLKELIDNSLDACEGIGIAPVIDVEAKDDFICVTDNGPGIPLNIIKKSLDYLIRVSDKAYYISPTRGQMGNALKTVYAAPYVHSGEGYVEIAANGKLHHIEITLDHLAQEPRIDRTTSNHFIKKGTFIKIHYPDSSSSLNDYTDTDSYNSKMTGTHLIQRYSAFNPHLTITYNGTRYEATNRDWKKWLPDMPTSPHWYDKETLRDLIAGYLYRERENGQHGKSHKTVRKFVSEFRGLSGVSKQKKVTASYSRAYLKDFLIDGHIDGDFIEDILRTMQEESTPPKPQVLGIIGSEHLTRWMIDRGCGEDSIKYTKKVGIDGNLPFVMEIAFGVKTNMREFRDVVTGLNWSPTIGNDTDRTITQALQKNRIDHIDPVIFIIHITCPRFEFLDRGKTRTEL